MTFDDLTSDDRQLPEPMAEGPNADPGMLNRGRILAQRSSSAPVRCRLQALTLVAPLSICAGDMTISNCFKMLK